jgi:Ca-activated chloride channel family protein
MQFDFEYPYFLYLTIFIPCFFVCAKDSISIYFAKPQWFKTRLSMFSMDLILLSLIYLFLVISMASPISYKSVLSHNKSGRDIVIAIDSSGSMVENGFNKNNKLISKYDVVINIIDKFLDTRNNDNIGVSIFGTFAFVASSITYDFDILRQMLHNTSANIAGQNTAIGEGLKVAIDILKQTKSKSKVIILLTDGYHNSGTISPQEAVIYAQQENIKIYTVGIGKDGTYDKKLLDTISHNTNGKSFSATNAKNLENVFKELDTLEPSKIKSPLYLNKTRLYIYFLFISIILLYIYFYRKNYD